MILDLMCCVPCSSGHIMVTKMMRLSPAPVLVDGKIAKTSEFEEYDFAAYCNQFTSSDFSLSNLSAIGATDLLSANVSMSMITNGTVADNLEKLAYVEVK